MKLCIVFATLLLVFSAVATETEESMMDVSDTSSPESLLRGGRILAACSATRCGIDYNDANGKCGVDCSSEPSSGWVGTGSGMCPTNEKCFSNVDCPCIESPPVAACSATRCGIDYNDANGKCGVDCSSEPSSGWVGTGSGICPTNEKCFSNVDCPCSESPPVAACSATRCGVDYNDANDKCGVDCSSEPSSGWVGTGSGICPTNEKCFSEVKCPCDNNNNPNPSPTPDGPSPPTTGDLPQIYYDVRDVLLSKKDKINKLMRGASWAYTPDMYNIEDFLDALGAAYNLPYERDDWLFDLGGERSGVNNGKGNLGLALGHIAVFLGQAKQESTSVGICDELSWGPEQATFPGRPGCGQRGKTYAFPSSTETWGQGVLYCLNGKNNPKPGSFACPLADPPNVGYIEGAQAADGADPMFCGTSGTLDCCWWGRGMIQITGQCNYGKFQHWYGSQLGMNVCGDPSQICDNDVYPLAKYWAAFGPWVGGISNNWCGYDFQANLRRWGRHGFRKGDSFVTRVGGLLNQGSCTKTAHGNNDRHKYTNEYLDVIRPQDYY